ncbi:hypothetical protein N431DRAFT_376162 [Stipitochalara longipes BDJ]|nr:hypothetical protein N431DRAFT_376162 [Stipitochalara longipes BDJ]
MTSLNRVSPPSEVGGDDSSFSASPSEKKVSTLPLQLKISHRYASLKHNIKQRGRDATSKRINRKLIRSAVIILLITTLAIVTWLALVLTVANRLRIPNPTNGLQQILRTYQAPNATSPANPTWLEDFSADILPVPCHSHNDYWHRVPLYEGLAAGCSSTEADIWLGNLPDGQVDLFVGHDSKALTQSRTLRSLYLDPLKEILNNQQPNMSANLDTSANAQQQVLDANSPIGVFSMSPNTSLVLLLDFKSNDNNTWSTVLAQLDDLRSRGWLTTWTPTKGIVERPLTIVASGDAPFDSIIANDTYRDIFYDAPLTKLPIDTVYNTNNSYYASTSLSEAIGRVGSWKLGADQKAKITSQVQRARELGLKSRYWSTPAWPVGWRNRVWENLMDLSADVLNVDDLIAAARWDWQMCVVAGINICNS